MTGSGRASARTGRLESVGPRRGFNRRILGSYVRDALKTGTSIQQALGYNPYKTGLPSPESTLG